MRAGMLYAIAACFGWAFAFIGPLILSDWPALAIAAGRYIAYGAASLLTLWLMHRRGTARLRDAGLWRESLLLTLSGNLLYYALLSIAVQKAGYVMPTLIIGLLPVTVSLAARLHHRLPLSPRYGWALLLIAAGLWLAQSPQRDGLGSRVAVTDDERIGWLCAAGSTLLWTVYGVINAERLKARPEVGGLQWTSLQGAAALPFALALFAATRPEVGHDAADWALFVAVSLFLGLVTSYVANTLWNLSSTRLPPSLLGQLIVFETIAGIAYGALWTGAWPAPTVLAGTVMLVGGVMVALGERQPEPASEPLV